MDKEKSYPLLVKSDTMQAYRRVSMPVTKTRVSEADKRAGKKYRRTKMLSIAFRLSRVYEQDLIDIYETIPNKSQWFKQAVREYGEKHSQ